MKMMTREMINNGLAMNGAIAGKLPNMRQVNPTKAINKELNKLTEEMKKDIVVIEAVEEYKRLIAINNEVTNIDYCVEQITEDVEWVNDSLELIYGKAYEGGIRYTEVIESPFVNKLY